MKEANAVLKINRLNLSAERQQLIQQLSNRHCVGQKKNTWHMSSRRQVMSKVDRHRLAIEGDQDVVVLFAPAEYVLIRGAFFRNTQVADLPHTYVGIMAK